MIASKNKIIRPLLIWLGISVMFFNMANHFQPLNYAFISAIFDTFSLFIVYKITDSFLYPRYYNKQKNYVLVSILIVSVLSILFWLIDSYVIPRIENPNHPKPEIFHLIRITFGSIFTFFIATSVKLMAHTKQLHENEKMLKEEKLETELKLLKAQINPHFIFNALNNIYSLTYMQAKNAPDSVLKLSEMLRYVFYECNKDKVPLTSEIQYIENFIAFQQMKSEFEQNISIQTNTKANSIEIAPMLFIPFIENAFKYSRIEENEDAFVTIQLHQENNTVRFKIENSVPSNNKPLAGSGTGIRNVKHRLSIIYPEKYGLTITDENDKYMVELGIES